MPPAEESGGDQSGGGVSGGGTTGGSKSSGGTSGGSKSSGGTSGGSKSSGGTSGGGNSGGGPTSQQTVTVAGPTIDNRYGEVWQLIRSSGDVRCSALGITWTAPDAPEVPVRFADVHEIDQTPAGAGTWTASAAPCSGQDVQSCAGFVFTPGSPDRCGIQVSFVGAMNTGVDYYLRIAYVLEATCVSREHRPCSALTGSTPTSANPVTVRYTHTQQFGACVAYGQYQGDTTEETYHGRCPPRTASDDGDRGPAPTTTAASQ